MTDLENLEARIDREKRQREEELLLLLLLLYGQAYRHALAAARVGMDPAAAVRDVLLGNFALGLPGGAARLAQRLAEAEGAGLRRALRVLNGSELPVRLIEMKPTDAHLSQARQALAKTVGALQRRIYLELGKQRGKGIRGAQQAVREAFIGVGLVESATNKAWLAETQAVTLTGFAYNGGYFAGFNTPDAREQLTGFRYSATLDSKTTPICRAYDGVKLPFEHPWWQTHWPLNHFNCRSVVLPIFGDFVATEPVWTPWPAIGFGHAPAIAAGLRYVRAA